jgi:hypothetical protein
MLSRRVVRFLSNKSHSFQGMFSPSFMRLLYIYTFFFYFIVASNNPLVIFQVPFGMGNKTKQKRKTMKHNWVGQQEDLEKTVK